MENFLRTVKAVRVAFPDGSEAVMESSLNMVCALAIVRGVSSVSGLTHLATCSVSLEEWEAASRIINLKLCSGNRPIVMFDVLRITRDSKYALFVQESLSSMRSWTEISGIVNSTFLGHVLELSVDSFGCRVIQKLIEIASLEDVLKMVHPELSGKIIDCAMDVNGNHVVQKLIDILPSEECQFIVNAILEDQGITLRRLCAHCFGCRVVQRIVSRCHSVQTEPVLEALCSDPALIGTLSADAFGNYVVQHALEYGRPIDRERIIVCLATMDAVGLCCCKFASNVIEKAIRIQNKPSLSTPNSVLVIRLLIGSLVAIQPNGESAIIALMKDRFGNYITRAIVELTNPEVAMEVQQVTRLIVKNAASLKKFTFSWHLVERLAKRGL